MINHGYISSMAIFQIHSVVLLVPTIAENGTKSENIQNPHSGPIFINYSYDILASYFETWKGCKLIDTVNCCKRYPNCRGLGCWLPVLSTQTPRILNPTSCFQKIWNEYPPQVLWSFSPFFLFVHLFSHLFPMKKVHHQPGPGPSLPSRSIAWIIAIRATTRRISRLPRRCSVHPRRGSGALRRMGPWVHGPSRFGSFGGFHLNLGVPKKKRWMVYFMENLPWKDGWELGVPHVYHGTPVLGNP